MNAATASPPDPDPAWTQISPLIDAAVAALADPERDALVLRFWENMTLKQVGQTLGISEETARQRIQRALNKLRRILTRQGVTPSAAGLGLLLGAHAVQAVPAGLAAAVTAAVSGGTASASAVRIAEGVRIMMVWMKVKLVAAICAAVLVAGGVGALVAQQMVPAPSVPRTAAGTQPAKELTVDIPNSATMKLVLIPAGKFLMGSLETGDGIRGGRDTGT